MIAVFNRGRIGGPARFFKNNTKKLLTCFVYFDIMGVSSKDGRTGHLENIYRVRGWVRAVLTITGRANIRDSSHLEGFLTARRRLHGVTVTSHGALDRTPTDGGMMGAGFCIPPIRYQSDDI